MASSPITLSRGMGWGNAEWEVAAPIAERAARKADHGLSILGVSFRVPKTGKLVRYDPEHTHDKFAGLAVGTSKYIVYAGIPRGYVPRAIVHSYEWSERVVHEVAHNIRNELVDDPSGMGKVAHEALAYSLEDAYAVRCGGTRSRRRFADSTLRRVNPRLFAQFESRFEDLKRPYTDSQMGWIGQISTSHEVSDLELLGVQLVQRQLRRGHEFAELMQMPSEEVLGL